MTGCAQCWPVRTATPSLIEDRAGVVRMHALEQERQHAGLVPRLADDPDAGNLAHARGRVREHSSSWASAAARSIAIR